MRWWMYRINISYRYEEAWPHEGQQLAAGEAADIISMLRRYVHMSTHPQTIISHLHRQDARLVRQR